MVLTMYLPTLVIETFSSVAYGSRRADDKKLTCEGKDLRPTKDDNLSAEQVPLPIPDEAPTENLPQEEPDEPVECITRGGYYIRLHKTKRQKLFVPHEAADAAPIDLKQFDVKRITITDLEFPEEHKINDDARSISGSWKGETRLGKIDENNDPNFAYEAGRKTRRQATTRSTRIWPEMWSSMTKKQRKKEIGEWLIVKTLIDHARAVQREGRYDHPNAESKAPHRKTHRESNVNCLVRGDLRERLSTRQMLRRCATFTPTIPTPTTTADSTTS